MTRLTYLAFHAVFVVPPLVVLAVAAWRRRARLDRSAWRARGLGLVLLTLVALVYTTPWDNYLIERGVWWYGDGAVVATVWLAPVEEYLFMLLQPVLAVLWVSLLAPPNPGAVSVTRRQRLVGVVAGGVVLLVGVVLLRDAPTYYLGAILAWAGPVLALQWGFGWPVLWATRRALALGVGVPTLYLWVADRVAIELGVWVISETYTTGVALLGLPVEEAAFFVVTNLFVVQGLFLFLWVLERWGWTTPASTSAPARTADAAVSAATPGREPALRTDGSPPRSGRPWRGWSTRSGRRGREDRERQ
ncbi:lycopene cyclase domain-containing protein [Salinigranum marinum]|uniref:lycopene cyclase domain-containing protein n=1 Tax=Salinigranum marinum TaxID=1515595 RepID=UPI002989FE7F|nr:lycopene cyclase domain-containing protein [Salinigranum marinum]